MPELSRDQIDLVRQGLEAAMDRVVGAGGWTGHKATGRDAEDAYVEFDEVLRLVSGEAPDEDRARQVFRARTATRLSVRQ